MKSALEVTIAGQRYVLRGDDGEERLRAVGELVAQTFERVRAASREGSANVERQAILAAVNLADDLLRERAAWNETADAVRQRAERLVVCLRSLAPLAAAADAHRSPTESASPEMQAPRAPAASGQTDIDDVLVTVASSAATSKRVLK